MATFPDTKYIYSIIVRSDIVANLIYSVLRIIYSGHVYSGHSDIVANLPDTKYIYSIIFRSDIVANRI